MTQEAEIQPLDLSMVSCQSCDLMFVASERRGTCPTCGGEAVGPYFEFVLAEDGLHRKDGAVEVKPPVSIVDEQREVAGMPPATAPVEEETPAEGGDSEVREPTVAMYIGAFLADAGVGEEDVRTKLLDLGADRTDVATAVGRLVAVRDLIRELAGVGVEASMEVEGEGGSEGGPEPSSESDNGSQSA